MAEWKYSNHGGTPIWHWGGEASWKMGTPNPYGFGVTVFADPEQWYVTLPHQCDEWDISTANPYESHQTRDQAIAALEAFIAEAQLTLAAIHRWKDDRAQEED